MTNLRPIAINLPQFHPIPENDAWWGKGFTEWTNVAKSQPRFPGHYQPQLPTDLGYYDLRLEESRVAQAEMAKAYGIYGFCYYHYWFNGRRILERPVDDILHSGKPDFPFCLCWANENWSRRWDGSDAEILLGQHYGEEDDVNHLHHLAPYFKDPRYIRVQGKPLFIVYKSSLLPDPRRTTDIWRAEALKLGIGELYLVRMEFDLEHIKDPILEGFDAGIEFQPLCRQLTQVDYETLWQKFLRKTFSDKKSVFWENRVFDFNEVVNKSINSLPNTYKIFPGACPSWDNSPRRKSNAAIFLNSSPDLYEKWLKSIVNKFTPYSKDENFVFINAWNEWAEGNHLEPCIKWGKKYLEATKRVFDNGNS